MSIISKALKKAQEMRAERQENKKASSGDIFVSKTDIAGQKEIALRKISPLVISVAVVLVLGISIGLLLHGRSPSTVPALTPPAAKKPKAPPAAQEDLTADIEETAIQKEGKPYEDKGLPEETADAFSARKSTGSFHRTKNTPVLNGIMYSPTLPQAILDGTMVSEGDVINGFSVIKILPDSVRLASEGEEFELKLR